MGLSYYIACAKFLYPLSPRSFAMIESHMYLLQTLTTMFSPIFRHDSMFISPVSLNTHAFSFANYVRPADS